MDVHVSLRSNEDGSAVAELVNRNDLVAELQQAIARGVLQGHGPPFKPYDPAEPEYSEESPPPILDVEHLKAEFTDEERKRLRSGARVPCEAKIPAGAMKTNLTEDVIKGALFRLLPECRQFGIRVVIDA